MQIDGHRNSRPKALSVNGVLELNGKLIVYAGTDLLTNVGGVRTLSFGFISEITSVVMSIKQLTQLSVPVARQVKRRYSPQLAARTCFSVHNACFALGWEHISPRFASLPPTILAFVVLLRYGRVGTKYIMEWVMDIHTISSRHCHHFRLTS
jgi:hypothetical protein